MTARTARRIAWSAWTASLAVGVLSFPLQAVAGFEPADVAIYVPVFAVLVLGFSTIGLLIACRQSGNAIGWIFLAVGVSWAASGLAQGYAYYALATGRTSSTLARIADWSGQWNWMPLTFLAPTLIALLFPNGQPLSRRWRVAIWVALGSTAFFTLTTAFAPGPLEDPVFLEENPFPLRVPESAIAIADGIGAIGMFAAFGASIISLVLRLRRSRGEERQQMKWLAFALVLTVAIVAAGFLIGGIMAVDSTTLAGNILIALILAALAFVPVAAGIAILKYRLYDIDVVINKTLVYGALAAFITAVYVAIAVGIGSVVGSADEPNLGLQIASTAVVAVAFQPVRERVQRLANRLVYGSRATPYEVMAGFSRRVAGTLSVHDVLREMAEAAGTGIGARRARVRLLLPNGERVVAWPDDGHAETDQVLAIPVGYRGEPIGEIAVDKSPGEPITPAERALLDDLASQAGLVMHNVRLTEDLAARADQLADQSEQLRRSRERLVTARDVQRRRLERDIREGPQQRLLAIGGRLRDATGRVERDPQGTAEILDDLTRQANSTLEGLRDLARGIFPPLLADRGIVPALQAHVRKVGADAAIEASPGFADERFDPDTEATVYFCCLQAIQNVVRHAGNARTIVRLERDADGAVVFSVRDEGPGFDLDRVPRGIGFDIMQDRVDALGGELEVVSSPGAGTAVIGRVPARTIELVPT
jgi:signal transduction histidine kinase